MTTSPIFGLRHPATEDVLPAREALELFLESPKGERSSVKHRDDLALYLADLKVIDDFEANAQRGLAETPIAKRRFLGVLSHVRFFNHSLKRVLEEYAYLYDKLRVLDFKKPRDFVRAVQEELDTLDPNSKTDQPKITRLRAKLDQRNEDLAALEKTRFGLTVELKGIASYLQENLARIQKLCELAIVTLDNLQEDSDIDKAAIENMKKQFKDELREQLLQGPVSRERAEQSKEDFIRHAKELSELAIEDRRAIGRIYGQVRDHVKKHAQDLAALIQQVEAKRSERFEAEREVLGRISQGLLSLVSDYRFGGDEPGEPDQQDDHDALTARGRRGILQGVFELLQGKPHASH